jgi:hypothetical protein
MQEFTDFLAHLEQKLSTIKVISDLLYAKMGDTADLKDEDAIVHFRASEVENLLVTLEGFVEEQDALIRDFIDNYRRQNRLENISK